MRIVSTFLLAEESAIAPGQPSVVMAFDTLVDERSYVVGVTVGTVQGPDLADVMVSAVGQAIIERCSTHHLRNYPQGAVMVAGVASIASAKQRVRQVLSKAPPNAFVLLVCANDKIYDAAFTALGVDLQSAHVQRN